MKRNLLFWGVAVGLAYFASCTSAPKKDWSGLRQDTLYVKAGNFLPGEYMSALGDSANVIHYVLKERDKVPYNQSVVRQTTEQAQYGPSAEIPYFSSRIFAASRAL